MTLAALLAEFGSARAERIRLMHKHFDAADPAVRWKFLIAVAAVLALFVIIRLLSQLQNRNPNANTVQPMGLFLRVQAQLGIRLLDRWRLWRLAKLVNVRQPTALLISPLLFDRAVEQYLAAAGRRCEPHLAAIRRQLFGQDLPPPLETALSGEPVGIDPPDPPAIT